MIQQHLKALGLLGLLGLAAFSNGLHGQFMIDDHAFFEEKLRNIKYLPLNFIPDKDRALHIEGESKDPFYRPLSIIVPMLSYLAFKDNVVGYHALNLVLFVLTSWGIYLFLSFLSIGFWWALVAAGLYLIHPINGVAVNYITASVFSVQVTSMLIAIWSLIQSSRSSGKVRRVLWYGPAVFFYFMAMFCHETAMVLPFYAFVLLAVYAPPVAASSIRSRLAFAGRVLWPLFVVLAVYYAWRMQASPLNESILSKIQLYHMSFATYLATWTMLLCWYLSRLFWPYNIVLIMAHQPLTHGFGIWFLALAILLGVGAYLLWAHRRDKPMLLALIWFFMGLCPFILACFFQPIHGLMIEPHWFIFPVIGFFVFAAGVLVRLEENHRRGLARTALAVIVFAGIILSHRQNWLWANEVRYCTFWLKESPDFVAVSTYLAKAYELRGDFDLARQQYRYSLGRGYKDYIAYTNMGLMDMQQGRWDSAEENLRKVLSLDPHASVAVDDLGVVYFKKGEYAKALELFEEARRLNRFILLPYLDISKTQLKLGNVKGAIGALEEALSINPDDDIALVDLIKIYIDLKDNNNVIRLARQIARLSPNPISIYNAGVLLDYYGFPDEGRQAIEKSQRIRAGKALWP